MKIELPGLKRIGSYVVALLVIVRFVIFPLQSSLAEKKLLLEEREQLWTSRRLLLQRQTVEKENHKRSADPALAAKLFYPKGAADSVIQAEVVKSVIESAEKKGLTLVNFEMPDVAREKGLTELGATLRFKGQPAGLVDLLRTLDEWPKALSIKSFESNKSGTEFLFSLTVAVYRIET